MVWVSVQKWALKKGSRLPGTCAESKGGTSRTASEVPRANSGGGDALGWAELGVQAGIGPFTTRDCPSGGEREPARARPVPNPKEGLVEARQR